MDPAVQLKSCMREPGGDCVRLEDALKRAKGSLGSRHPVVLEGEAVLGRWLRRCGRVRQQLLEAVERRSDLQTLVRKIQDAEGDPEKHLMRSDIRRAKNLVVTTEKAMQAIRPALDSGSPEAVNDFLTRYHGVLPDDVYSEVSAIRDNYLKDSEGSEEGRGGRSPIRGRIEADFEGYVTDATPGRRGATGGGGVVRARLTGGSVNLHSESPPRYHRDAMGSRPPVPILTPDSHYLPASVRSLPYHPTSRTTASPYPSSVSKSVLRTQSSPIPPPQYLPPAPVPPPVALGQDDAKMTERLRLYLAEINSREKIMREERRCCQVILKDMVADLSANKTLRVHIPGAVQAPPHPTPPPLPPPQYPSMPWARVRTHTSPIPPASPSPPTSFVPRPVSTPGYLSYVPDFRRTPEVSVPVPYSPGLAVVQPNDPRGPVPVPQEQLRRQADGEEALKRAAARLSAEERESLAAVVQDEADGRQALEHLAELSKQQAAFLERARQELTAFEATRRCDIKTEEEELRKNAEVRQSFEGERLTLATDRISQFQREDDRARGIEAKLVEAERRIMAKLEQTLSPPASVPDHADRDELLATIQALQREQSTYREQAEQEKQQLVAALNEAKEELVKLKSGERKMPSLEVFMRAASEMIMDEQRGRYSMWEDELRTRTDSEINTFRLLKTIHKTLHLSTEETAERGLIERAEGAGMADLETSPEIMRLFELLEETVAQTEEVEDEEEEEED